MASSYKYCIFCSKPHSPVNCQTYLTVSHRRVRLNKFRRCYQCLKTGHISQQCTEYVNCGICGCYDHHTVLCFKGKWCVFCKKHHNSSNCRRVQTHRTRLNHVFNRNLWQTCLKPCHPKWPCQAESLFEFCNANTHHESLCPQNLQFTENYEADPSNGICTFCSNHHDPVNCPIYPTISVRRERLNKLGCCYRCLKAGHMTPQCTEYVGCGICKLNSHHTALCCKNELIQDGACSKYEICVFCDKHNNSSNCRRFHTLQKRMDRALDLNLCQICLNQCHPNQLCQAELSPCKFCNATTHHKALCPRNPQLDENYETDPSIGICIFCGKHNQPALCNQRGLQVRLNLLAAQGRCQRCLRTHSTENCESRSRCRICRSSDHHNVVCPLDPSLILPPVPLLSLKLYKPQGQPNL